MHQQYPSYHLHQLLRAYKFSILGEISKAIFSITTIRFFCYFRSSVPSFSVFFPIFFIFKIKRTIFNIKVFYCKVSIFSISFIKSCVALGQASSFRIICQSIVSLWFVLYSNLHVYAQTTYLLLSYQKLFL